VIWLGSAAAALSGLAAAARAGDGAAVLARTDVRALTRSLSTQVVAAYLARLGANRPVSPMQKMLANSYGASIADAMIGKMLTAENLTRILQTGTSAVPDLPAIGGLPALGELRTEAFSILGRFSPISPSALAVRLSATADEASYAAIELHREGLDWKLAGFTLPKAQLNALAAALPAK
jgi:hypothetical protein